MALLSPFVERNGVYGLEETRNIATESKFSYERSEFIESANKAPESPDWLHT